MLDNAVVLVGTVIENAANETMKVGSDEKPEWKPKYRMADLLDDHFRLPNPDAVEPIGSFESQLKGVHGLAFDEVS